MKKLLITLVLCLSTLLASDSVAVLKNIKNSLEIHRDGSTITKIDEGMSLIKGDVLKSSNDANADIIFKDGTKVRLGANSILSIDDYIYEPANKKYNFELSLNKGVAVYESGKLSDASHENIKFKVPTGTIGVRGTKFLVEVE